jgi:hypothetical protein
MATNFLNATRRSLLISLQRRALVAVPFSVQSIPVVSQGFKRQANSSTLPSVLLTSVLASAVVITSCDDASPVSTATSEETPDTTPGPQRPPNAVWSTVISEKDIEDLVEDILKDPTINISTVPDYLERQIYHSTIRLTLSAIYDALGSVHGTQLLGHELHLSRSKNVSGKQRSLRLMRGDIDEEILEEVADRLLANTAINQKLIPDSIERKLYVNCLKLVFRIMDLLAASFCLTVCEHEFMFSIERSARQDIARQAATRVSSSLTAIDLKALKEYARQVGIEDEHATEMTFFQRLLEAPQKEFVAQLHASLYGLILGIIDDLLANSKLEILTDTIQFDIAPKSKDSSVVVIPRTERQTSPPKESSSALIPMATFTAGVGVGVILVALLAAPGAS